MNRIDRIILRNRMREYIAAEQQRLYTDAVATLEAAALTRIRAEWADKQDDMAVLAKYQHAAPIKGANLRVYNPDSERYDETFGIELDAGLLMPSTGYGHAYWAGYVARDDSDYPAVWAVVETRRRWKQIGIEHTDALDAALRATGSLKKILAQFPMLAEAEGARP